MSFVTERRYPRLPFASLPWVFSLQLKEAAPGDQPFRVEARDISRCGIKFFSNRKIPLFEQVYVVLFAKADGRELARLTGKVVRLEDIDTGMGERTYGIALDLVDGADALHKLLPDRDLGTKGSGT
jgi:hypothetical protein